MQDTVIFVVELRRRFRSPDALREAVTQRPHQFAVGFLIKPGAEFAHFLEPERRDLQIQTIRFGIVYSPGRELRKRLFVKQTRFLVEARVVCSRRVSSLLVRQRAKKNDPGESGR